MRVEVLAVVQTKDAGEEQRSQHAGRCGPDTNTREGVSLA
ncbi:hypothetical protein P3T22_003677 [Paraburkholderia sp. GAS348]